MKRLCAWMMFLFCGCFLIQAASLLPKPETIQLANGLKVYYFRSDELPLVAFRLLVKGAGTVQDLLPGTADLTAELLSKGTKTRSAEQVAEAIDFLGASLSISAREEYAEASGLALAENFPALMSIASDCLLHPTLAQDEFVKEKSRRLERLKAVKDNPAQAVQFYFRQAYFGSHPLAHLGIGSETPLHQIDSKTVQNFYRKQYRPDQALLAVVGNIDKKELDAVLQSTIGTWAKPAPAPSGVPLAPLPRPKAKTCLLIDKPDATQAYFVVGVPGLAEGEPRSAVAQVMNTLFGGRFTSWLNTELRIKRGLTYGARSGLQSWREGGIYTISSFTRNEKIGEMLEIAFQLMGKGRQQGFSEEEIQSSRNYILGQFPPTLESLLAKARAYTNLSFNGRGFDYYSRYLEAVQKTDREAANRLARELLPENNFVLVVVGNAAEIRTQLAKFGTFQEKKISDPDF